MNDGIDRKTFGEKAAQTKAAMAEIVSKPEFITLHDFAKVAKIPYPVVLREFMFLGNLEVDAKLHRCECGFSPLIRMDRIPDLKAYFDTLSCEKGKNGH